MIESVHTVADPDELDLLELLYDRDHVQVVASGPRGMDMVADAGVEPASDDQRQELYEELGAQRGLGLDPLGPAAQEGLVGGEELLRAVPALVQQQRIAGRHFVG